MKRVTWTYVGPPATDSTELAGNKHYIILPDEKAQDYADLLEHDGRFADIQIEPYPNGKTERSMRQYSFEIVDSESGNEHTETGDSTRLLRYLHDMKVGDALVVNRLDDTDRNTI